MNGSLFRKVEATIASVNRLARFGIFHRERMNANHRSLAVINALSRGFSMGALLTLFRSNGNIASALHKEQRLSWQRFSSPTFTEKLLHRSSNETTGRFDGGSIKIREQTR